jgi:septal ring factor EnvC (AmiA/AmiB activator)
LLSAAYVSAFLSLCLGLDRRTRKAAADAASELTSSQAALANLSAQVASKQGSLAGVEASLAAKSKELQEVLSQLQAAAAQEFKDAKQLLLKEGELAGRSVALCQDWERPSGWQQA